MTLLSIHFLVFFLFSLGVYYIFHKKHQWIVLLVSSIAFFALSSTWYSLFYVIICAFITWFSASFISSLALCGKKEKCKIWLIIGVLGDFILLGLLKYTGFVLCNINSVARIIYKIPTLIEIHEWIAPIGISFYTLSAISYIVDCYNGVCRAEKNPFKVMLYVCYWPILTSGPILIYGDMCEKLFHGHDFDIDRICLGIQRMLWGIIKKLVISARLGIIVDAIYSDTENYNGLYIWIAAVAFVFQLYTDFSGCMDIVLGASECYGIILPENFRMPFFSKSIQEFWQRWHITLGTWYRNYILYPVMNTRWMSSLEHFLKKKYSRKVGRRITSCIGMLVVWLLFGLWHGGKWKYVAMGLYFFILITVESITQNWFDKLWMKLKVPTDTTGWKALRCLKVFILVTVGDMFFRVQNIKITLATWKLGLKWNPWIFFDNSLYNLGLSQRSFNVLLIGGVVLFIVSLYKRNGDVRQMIARQPLLIRWSIYLVLIITPVIFGIYGSEYNAAAFIYEGF